MTGVRRSRALPDAAGSGLTPHAPDGASVERLSRREHNKQAMRHRLLDAASALFVERGFEQTTYDDVAERAGVARQTVFNYFPRKEDFIVVWGDARRAQISQMLKEHANAAESPLSSLLLALAALADFYEAAPAAGRVFTLAWVKWGGPIIEERTSAQQFAEVLQRAQLAGEVRHDIDVSVAGQLIRAAYFDALWAWAGAPTAVPGASLLGDILDRVDLLLRGICVEAEKAGYRRAVDLVRSLERTRAVTSKQQPPSR